MLLRRSGIQPKDLVDVYIQRIHPIIEYACPVWHTCLTKGQSDLLETIQKRALNIIKPNLKYDEARDLFKLPLLSDRRTDLSKNFFKGMLKEDHKLHHLLGPE